MVQKLCSTLVNYVKLLVVVGSIPPPCCFVGVQFASFESTRGAKQMTSKSIEAYRRFSKKNVIGHMILNSPLCQAHVTKNR